MGYLDRFIGIIEKKISAFNFEDDIASCDTGGAANEFAIPSHRIQYFKYRGELVWDRRGERFDNIFGSWPPGNATTIYAAMPAIDARAGPRRARRGT